MGSLLTHADWKFACSWKLADWDGTFCILITFFYDGESAPTNVLYHAASWKGETIRFFSLTKEDVSITVVMVLVCNNSGILQNPVYWCTV